MPRQNAKVLAEPLLVQRPTPSWGQRHWAPIFYANVFMACISFSVVMPSLWLYLHKMGSNHAFYAGVVSSYSIGEAAGSLMFGSLSNSFGTRRTLLLCCIVSCTGAVSYAMAFFVYTDVSAWAAPFFVLLGRLLQGTGSGGQQAVEQAYLSIAVTTAQRTEYTGKLSTFACSGFICGPALAAVVGALPAFRLGSLVFDCFTIQGWSCAVMNVLMYLLYFVFEEVTPADRATDQQAGGSSAARGPAPSTPIVGVLACIFFFFVHFNGFAVQETITTPLVQDWFGWKEVAANVLFTGAGLLNLICAVLMAYLCSPRGGAEGAPQRVPDHVLLVASLLVAPLGWLCMVPPSAYDRDWPSMSVAQFLTGFGLVTVAFPFGRGVCLSMVGKLLGDRPQGTWMGITFAVGAIARIVGPFWAVQGYRFLGALVVFGGTAALYVLSLVCVKLVGETIRAEEEPPGTSQARRVRSRRPSGSLVDPRGFGGSPTCGARPTIAASPLATFGEVP